MTEWMPIETAPKDGAKVILLYAGGTVITSSYSNSDTFSHGKLVSHYEGWSTPWMTIGDEVQPTHWMPLPSAPEEVV